jgi:2-phosphoglycerate kinase
MTMQDFYNLAIRYSNKSGKSLTEISEEWNKEKERTITKSELLDHANTCIEEEKENCKRFYELNPMADNERKNTSIMIISSLTRLYCTLDI